MRMKEHKEEFTGRMFLRSGAGLAEIEGPAWDSLRLAEEKRLSFWHEERERAGRVTYYKRRLKGSDLNHKTIELRPDHSRALEVLAASQPRSLVEEALSAIRAETIRLFEESYKRKVMAVGELRDSGNFRTEVWHFSSEETKLGDRTIIKKGTRFREYGVGPGLVRWDRQLRVLTDLGHDPAVMGAVPGIIESDAALALARNREPARDLALLRALDAFVEKTLRKIDLGVVGRAKVEFGEHLLASLEKKSGSV